ncbi:MAG: 2-oxoacid:acceptor oxidoreductase family protein [Planctomycetota bacterium]
MESKQTINIVFAGLGGQGVLKSSDICAEAAFRAGRDVKKAEIHGMSQRGGSVTSDVRIGEKIHSPMVPEGEADFLVVLSGDQVEVVRHQLKSNGVLISAEAIDPKRLPHPKSLNVGMLGALSTHLQIDASDWMDAIHANLPGKVHQVNEEAFALGQEIARSAD